jgi:hypothetical protein
MHDGWAARPLGTPHRACAAQPTGTRTRRPTQPAKRRPCPHHRLWATRRPIGVLDTDPPSLVRFVFTDARARAAYPEWDRVADQHAANLKIHSGHTDPHLTQLADELTITAGAAFTDRFGGPPIIPRRTGVERLLHPDVGDLRLAYETLDLPDAANHRLVVYLPADEAASTALDQLTGRQPGALRAMNGRQRPPDLVASSA